MSLDLIYFYDSNEKPILSLHDNVITTSFLTMCHKDLHHAPTNKQDSDLNQAERHIYLKRQLQDII